MDNTELFKAVVKTVRLRLKAVKRDTGSLNDALFKQKNKKEKSEFFKLAINTVNHHKSSLILKFKLSFYFFRVFRETTSQH